MNKVKHISVRPILNSCGGDSLETSITLENGSCGVASAASAILAGRRENPTTRDIKAALAFYSSQIQDLVDAAYTQREWDDELYSRISVWGTDLVLSLSLAFARAVAADQGKFLVDYISECSGIPQKSKRFTPLIPIFSGGVHAPSLGGSVQQIMLAVSGFPFEDAVDIIRRFYFSFERRLMEGAYFAGYSASSGFLVRDLSIEDELSMLSEAITKSELREHLSIAIDVAAEHLRTPDGYQFYHDILSIDELEGMLLRFAQTYPISYIEDPFDSADITSWASLHDRLPKGTAVISDDLSATQTHYLNPSVSDGVIVKMKQVGTLSATLDLIRLARVANMKICVSHRSIETVDTFMCDLGVASNADYMKIGGPRSGERVAKYNRLMKILGYVGE